MINEENKNLPAVTAEEIKDWEDKFKENVTPYVKFELQDGSHSMKLYSGISGIDATWSGTILLQSDNYIKWTFTLQGEPFVEARFAINEDTRYLIEKIYNMYDEWKKYWSESLSVTPEPKEAPQAAPVQESKSRTKESIIKEHSDRMKRLAGF
jgi:hypothetical protein